jgi:pseudaminic acid biosynthesis-associated methylase
MTTRDPLHAWRGPFGEAYIARNELTPERHARKLREWARLLRALGGRPPATVLEVGANVGQNIAALRDLTAAEISAVEPNPTARRMIADQKLLPPERIHDATADKLPFADDSFDLAFTYGVLIHVAPEALLASCREIYRVSRRFILCAEYLADQPTEKRYRGEDGLLFLRDFGAFWMDNFPELELVDYGCFWKRVDNDTMNWWIFERRAASGADGDLGRRGDG